VHSGTPDIDPDKHRLVIHGLVKRPLAFTLDALARYPMVSRMTFVECGGTSAPMFSKEPIQASVQALHGLASCAEWTGVPLSTLLEETGIDPKAKWLVAEGADSLALSRSVPLTKALDDAMVALYQNGERLMPGNGYPMRLAPPRLGRQHERQIPAPVEVGRSPGHELLRDPHLFTDPAGRKGVPVLLPAGGQSFITHPSPGLALKGPGYYEISGIAYSGNGRFQDHGFGRRRAELGAGGPAGAGALQGFYPVPHALAVGRRSCGPAKPRLGRAGNVQPTRAQFVAQRGETQKVPNVLGFPNQHYNSLTSWRSTAKGR